MESRRQRLTHLGADCRSFCLITPLRLRCFVSLPLLRTRPCLACHLLHVCTGPVSLLPLFAHGCWKLDLLWSAQVRPFDYLTQECPIENRHCSAGTQHCLPRHVYMSRVWRPQTRQCTSCFLPPVRWSSIATLPTVAQGSWKSGLPRCTPPVSGCPIPGAQRRGFICS